jgi:hypothetical protein
MRKKPLLRLQIGPLPRRQMIAMILIWVGSGFSASPAWQV